MPDPVTFRHAALNTVYAQAQTALAGKPDAEQKLATIATRLAALDTNDRLSDTQLAQQARSIIRAVAPNIPVLRAPSGPGATTPGRSDAITITDGVSLSSRDGLPLLNGRRPTNWSQGADAMYGLGTAIEQRTGDNLFARLGPTQRAALLTQVESMINGGAFAGAVNDSLAADAATQLRSTCATTLRELLAAGVADDSPKGRQLTARALNLAVSMAKTETDRGLRDSMTFGLYAMQSQLPDELKPVTRSLMREVAPLAPPYEKWLADGKVGLDFVVDGDWINVSSAARKLEGWGFERVSGTDPMILRKTVGHGDNAALVEIRLRTNRTNMFDSVGNDKFDIVYYMGHSSYGRAIPRSVNRAGRASGEDQLLMFATCFGKDNMQHVRAQFPEAEVMATFNSAYQYEVWPALQAVIEGVGRRRSWSSISREIGGPNRGNWVTPAEVMIRRRMLDRDGDGRADILDRMYDVNLEKVDESMRQAFTPRDPGAPPHRLQSVYGVIAANWLNRGAGAYNEAIHAVNSRSRVACEGFFAGQAGDPPVKFEKTKLPDGTDGWTMRINDQFAHVPEEALRAIAAFEFNNFLAQTDSRFEFHGDPLRARLNGLMAVGFTLSHDLYRNDSQVWRNLLSAYGLPNISLHEIEDFAARNGASNRDVDGGSKRNIDELIAHLEEHNPSLLEALNAADVGTYRAPG